MICYIKNNGHFKLYDNYSNKLYDNKDYNVYDHVVKCYNVMKYYSLQNKMIYNIIS